MKDKEIREFFESCGKIVYEIILCISDLEVPRNEGVNSNKGRAFIEFQSVVGAEKVIIKFILKALALNKHLFKDSKLKITRDIQAIVKPRVAPPVLK